MPVAIFNKPGRDLDELVTTVITLPPLKSELLPQVLDTLRSLDGDSVTLKSAFQRFAASPQGKQSQMNSLVRRTQARLANAWTNLEYLASEMPAPLDHRSRAEFRVLEEFRELYPAVAKVNSADEYKVLDDLLARKAENFKALKPGVGFSLATGTCFGRSSKYSQHYNRIVQPTLALLASKRQQFEAAAGGTQAEEFLEARRKLYRLESEPRR